MKFGYTGYTSPAFRTLFFIYDAFFSGFEEYMTEILLSGWRFRAMVLSIVAASLGYLAFSVWGGLDEVINGLQRIGITGILVMLALSLVNYALRFVRWQIYLGALGHSIPWFPSFKIYIAGFALTTTPGKAGEAVRSVFLKRWGVSYTKSLAALFSERIADIIAIVLLTSFGLSMYSDLIWLVAACAIGILVGTAILSKGNLSPTLLLWSEGRGSRIATAVRHLAHLLLEAQQCLSLRLFVPTTLLSVFAWGAEALAFYLMLGWMGEDISMPFAIYVYAIAMLAGALSFLPGGLGGAEAVMAGLLLWKGIAPPEAVVATILIRVTTLWFAVVLGVTALVIGRSSEANTSRPDGSS